MTLTPHLRAALFLALLTLFLPACRELPQPKNEDLPKLIDIRSDLTRPGPPEGVMTRPANAVFSTLIVGVPITTDLTEAWQQLATDTLSPSVLERLRTNGLVAGTLPSNQITRWISELPPPSWPMGRERSQITTGSVAVLETRRLAIDFAVDTGQGEPTLTRGPLSLRIMLQKTIADRLTVAAVPAQQITSARFSTEPITNLEDRYRFFESLALSLPAATGTAVLFTLAPETGQRLMEPLQAPDDQRQVKPPRLPIAVPLLALERGGIVWQRIVIIRVESIDPGS
ncbi:MAG: hypothetical protein RLN76_00075 [Phycisphaeraceae bacterium]